MNQPLYKPITCRHCSRQLALATPTRLLFNEGSSCDKPVTLRCNSCGAERFWRALLDESAQMCYAEPELAAA